MNRVTLHYFGEAQSLLKVAHDVGFIWNFTHWVVADWLFVKAVRDAIYDSVGLEITGNLDSGLI